MSCGQKYAYLVQSGGYGPDNPTGYKPWASNADVNGWLATARTIFDLVRGRWNALVRAENDAKRYGEAAALKPYVERYETAWRSLPEPRWYQAAGLDGELALVVANAQAGACALELLDGALERIGAPPEPTPWAKPPADKIDPGQAAIGGLGIVAGVGLVLLAATAFGGRRRS